MDTILAENMKKLREEHSLTQETLAEALEVSPIDIYMWEAGRAYPDKRKIIKIAEFFEISVDTLLESKADDTPEIPASDHLPLNCKMCGGELIHNYLAGTCKCANCGKKRAISELYPGFAKYTPVIAAIAKANEILNGKTLLASADEANLLYKQAINECNKFNDMVSLELLKICNEGLVKVKQFEIYCRGKHFFDNKSFKSAMNELEKIRGYRDADEMIERCKVKLESSHKGDIPWAVVFSLIIPGTIAISLAAFAGWPIWVCILIFLAGSAGLGYIIYRGGVPSIIIKVISFLCLAATPLILILILAYLLHFHI
ncbi:MAG: helix-turn-helix domain-containing protein [Saccharofermentans sp.]|nr:helix-turn-helix domain-containing protein [Saccharofermentans sp.]